MQAKGIDVSTWQGIIDWPKVKASGVDFAMLRASYGWKDKDKQTDSQFHRNRKEAKAAGVKCGAYHYSYATTVEEAKKEAAFFLDIIKGYSFEYPVAFDMEDKCQKNLGRKLLTDIAYTFMEEVEKAGYYVCLYTNLDWIRNRLDMERLSRFDLWLAQWNKEPTYEGSFGIWQYTSRETVPGIAGSVDMDISYKDYPTIIKGKGLNGFAAAKPAAPAQKPEPSKPKTYTVKAGDTPWDLAVKFLGDGTRYKELMDLNGIKSPYTIYAGQVLKLPGEATEKPEPVRTYTVKAGDTPWGIAEKFYGSGNEYIKLIKANNLQAPYTIYAGQVLKIPK